MTTFTFEDFHGAYRVLLCTALTNPDHHVVSRGRGARELVDVVFHVCTPSPDPISTLDPERNKVIEAYTKREFQLYGSLQRDVKSFEEASKFWGKLANPDKTINSAYGWLIWRDHSYGHPEFEKTRGQGDGPVKRTPWEWCVDALKRDQYTRQATLKFAKREHFWVGNYDVTCTLHGQFSIRDDKLHLSMVMRSSDLVLGIVYDLPFFAHLQRVMVTELKDSYPKLKPGEYTHHSHSLHVYDDDYERACKMAGIAPILEKVG